MNLLNLPIFEAITGKMEWLNRRQGVLSQNLANADTPGYTPHDLEEIDFSALVQPKNSAKAIHEAQLAKAMDGDEDGSHIGKNTREIPKKGMETTPAGNSVVLEEQLINVAETQIQYSMLTNLYRKQADLVRLAIGRR